MQVSNRIQWNGVKVGDILARYNHGATEVLVIGRVIGFSDNARGQGVVLLDRAHYWGDGAGWSDRIRKGTFHGRSIRRIVN